MTRFVSTSTAPPPSAIKDAVAHTCAREPAVLAAYLFGSIVRPEAREPRDIDVAVLLDIKAADLTLPLRLANALQDALGNRDVDLVVLNRAGELLKHEVRRTGTVVFDRDPGGRKAFEIRGRRAYEDFRHLHRRYVRQVIYGGDDGQSHSG